MILADFVVIGTWILVVLTLLLVILGFVQHSRRHGASKKQIVKGGHHSTNLQAGGDIDINPPDGQKES